MIAAALCAAAYFAFSVRAYQHGYVIGYERHNAYWDGRENKHNQHRDRNNNGIGVGVMWAIGGPLSVLVLWVGRNLTPTPPSRAAQLQDENAVRLDQIERELKLGPYREDVTP